MFEHIKIFYLGRLKLFYMDKAVTKRAKQIFVFVKTKIKIKDEKQQETACVFFQYVKRIRMNKKY